MLISKAEANILLTAGFYKAIPANLSADLGGDILQSLLSMNLLKTNRSKTACRLSNFGRELLAKAGYEFKHDKHPLGDGDLLTRRLQSAETALALQQIGVDIFLKDLPRKPVPQTYLSAYALRKNSCSNILGMAKFSGYYFAPNITYIIYHLESKLSGFYPNTESDTFIRHMQSIGSEWQVLFMGGNNYNEMFNLLKRKKESKLKNDKSFYDAVDEFEGAGFLPLNSTGLRVLRIMNAPDYRKKIADSFEDSVLTGTNAFADGFHEGECMQVNLDNNLHRQCVAVNRYKMIHQISPKQDYYWSYGEDEINHVELSLENMEDKVGIGQPENLLLNAFVGKNGKAIELRERKAYA